MQRVRVLLMAAVLVALVAAVFGRDGDALASITGSMFPAPLGKGCPEETNLGAYGRAAIYDHTIRIDGSPEFVSRTMIALDRLYGTSGYRYVKALRRIVERPDGPPRTFAWIYPGTATANIMPRAANRSCTAYASTLVHEASHELGHGEYGAYKIQAKILRELGEDRAARVAENQAEFQTN